MACPGVADHRALEAVCQLHAPIEASHEEVPVTKWLVLAVAAVVTAPLWMREIGRWWRRWRDDVFEDESELLGYDVYQPFEKETDDE